MKKKRREIIDLYGQVISGLCSNKFESVIEPLKERFKEIESNSNSECSYLMHATHHILLPFLRKEDISQSLRFIENVSIFLDKKYKVETNQVFAYMIGDILMSTYDLKLELPNSNEWFDEISNLYASSKKLWKKFKDPIVCFSLPLSFSLLSLPPFPSCLPFLRFSFIQCYLCISLLQPHFSPAVTFFDFLPPIQTISLPFLSLPLLFSTSFLLSLSFPPPFSLSLPFASLQKRRGREGEGICFSFLSVFAIMGVCDFTNFK